MEHRLTKTKRARQQPMHNKSSWKAQSKQASSSPRHGRGTNPLLSWRHYIELHQILPGSWISWLPQDWWTSSPCTDGVAGRDEAGRGGFRGDGPIRCCWFAISTCSCQISLGFNHHGGRERERQREKTRERSFPLGHGGCFISRETHIAGSLSSGTETTNPTFQT